MASSYTDMLRLEKQANGENSTTWGTKVNTVFEMLEDSIHGTVTIATTGGTEVLSTNNSATDQARMAILKIAGTLVDHAVIQVPALSHKYLVWNATSGDFNVTIEVSGGVAATVEQGARTNILCDATDCYALISGFEATTAMIFWQAAAPTGWTKASTYNNYALRIVTGGTGGGNAGAVAFSTLFAAGYLPTSVSATGLSTAQMPAHTHTTGKWVIGGAGGIGEYINSFGGTKATSSTGSGSTHTHTISSPSMAIKYLDMIICTKD